jgi:hypothetical protein
MQIEYAADCNAVNGLVANVLGSYEQVKLHASSVNKKAVEEHFFPGKTTQGWLTIFDELSRQ